MADFANGWLHMTLGLRSLFAGYCRKFWARMRCVIPMRNSNALAHDGLPPTVIAYDPTATTP